MSIDHGKVLVACRRKLEAYRDAYGLEYVGGQELSSLLADIDRALAQPAEAVEGDAHLKAVAQWFIATLGDLPDDYASLTSEKVQSALAANRHAYDDAMSGSLGSDDAAQVAVAPDDTCVICPACAHQFRAIPMQVQSLLLAAGYSPPFYTHPQAAPAQGDGWKLVPVNATEEMRSAFAIAMGDTRILGAKEQFRIAYAKLLAAAPTQEGE